MTSLNDTSEIGQRVDTVFHYGGLLIRAIGYVAVYALAGRYDCGPSILTGVLLGDFIGQAARALFDRRQILLVQFGELFMIGVVYLFVRSAMVWPDDPAMRAIVGLSAFGVFVGHAGTALLPRVDENLI